MADGNLADVTDRNPGNDMHPYATLAYARTLGHVGRPVYVGDWNMHVIAREWKPQVSDAMGPYPMSCFATDSDLRSGIDNLRREGLVSVILVVDGIASPPIARFEEAFEFVQRFKTHYLVDPSCGTYAPCKHHRYEIRRALRSGVEVRRLPLAKIFDAWVDLYDGLVRRHGISGVQRFPRESFVALTKCEGLSAIAAFIGEELVSCHLWFQHDGLAWSHLAASNALGYATGAAYAVCDYSIRSFSGHVIDLGGVAGAADSADDGLARFKAGFSNRSSSSFLCGAVLDPGTYQELCLQRGVGSSNYFPAYRNPSVP